MTTINSDLESKEHAEVVSNDQVSSRSEISSFQETCRTDAPTLPFMLSTDAEICFFEDWHDESLVIHLIIASDPLLRPGAIVDFEQLENFLNGTWDKLPRQCTLPSGSELELSGGIPTVFTMPGSLATRLTAKQRQWLHNGCYLQLGFSLECKPCNFDLNPAIFTAMTLYDLEVVGSGSLHPEKHLPKRRPGLDDYELIYAVSRVFDEDFGSADWNHSLVPLRNELLIRFGAELRGLDPDVEFKRFVSEGHDYFLDFVFSK